MSVDRPSAARRLLLAGSLACAFGAAAAAEAPDPEFLEYLGSWEGADDEWLIAGEGAPSGEEDSNDGKPVEPGDGAEQDADNDAEKWR